MSRRITPTSSNSPSLRVHSPLLPRIPRQRSSLGREDEKPGDCSGHLPLGNLLFTNSHTWIDSRVD
jgi:hypothetical protein